MSIPRRDSRLFAHGADIYESTVKLLREIFPGASPHDLRFEFHRPLNSGVTASLVLDSEESPIGDAVVRGTVATRRWRILLQNRPPSLEERTYRFDESLVRPALSKEGGRVKFVTQIHPSNIHMILSPIKFLLPFWPTDNTHVNIARMHFDEDVQTLDWRALSLSVNARASFNVTTVFHNERRLGEIVHVFAVEAP